MIKHIVHEEGSQFGGRLQEELVGILFLFVAPQSQRLVGMLSVQPSLKSREVLLGKQVSLVPFGEFDEGSHQDGEDVPAAELKVLLVGHLVEQ